MKRYFIHYKFITKDGRAGEGNVESNLKFRIKGIDDIRNIEKSIIRDNEGFEKVVINNYIKF